MVVIRLSRKGTNKRPFYHVVAADSRFSRDGRNIEKLGYFNPIAAGKEKRLFLNLERVEYWVSVGAKPSDRVTSLLNEAKKIPDVTTPQKPTYKKHATGPDKPLQVTTSAEAPKAKQASGKSDARKPTAKKSTKPVAKKPAPKKAASAKTEG